MKYWLCACALFLLMFGLPQTMLADQATSSVPLGLEIPADQSLLFTVTARGVQIYKCNAVSNTADQFEWMLKAPEADLFDENGRKIGRHFAGPTWELTEGGSVVGKVKCKVDAPDGKGAPWLRLDAVQASGPLMGNVKSVVRINTVGGKAPSEPSNAANFGQEKRVDYSATYKFYGVAR